MVGWGGGFTMKICTILDFFFYLLIRFERLFLTSRWWLTLVGRCQLFVLRPSYIANAQSMNRHFWRYFLCFEFKKKKIFAFVILSIVSIL